MAEDPLANKSRYELSQQRVSASELAVSANQREDWGPVRIKMSELLDWKGFDITMNLLIFLNVAILIPEIDDSAQLVPSPYWRWLTSQLLVLVFVSEICWRVFVLRCEFFHSEMNVLDFIVVALDVLAFLLEFVVQLPSTSVARIFRLGKLLRARRLLKGCHEIEVIFSGIAGAARTIAFGTGLIGILLLVWSLIAVEIVHPLMRFLIDEGALEGCERCPRAFASVGDALVTFVQIIIAGDGWGDICLPLIERYPALLVFFILVTMTVDMGILNLMLSAIVDNAHERRLRDEQLIIREKNDAYARARDALLKVCSDMDYDGSGQLTFAEIQNGYDKNPDFFDMLHILDVEQEDLHLIFRTLDGDHNGAVSYEEFIAQLHKLKTQETHSMLMFMKCYLKDLKLQNDDFGAILKDLQAEQLEELKLLQTQPITSAGRTDWRAEGCGLGAAGDPHKSDPSPNGFAVLIQEPCRSWPATASSSLFKLKTEL